LYFAEYAEFREILDELVANRLLAGQLGRQGREYVLANYQPGQVAARYLETLGAWFD
jgi:glycosyltransferase involved in cell wall biosynthesis